jgi:hypothetical protein
VNLDISVCAVYVYIEMCNFQVLSCLSDQFFILFPVCLHVSLQDVVLYCMTTSLLVLSVCILSEVHSVILKILLEHIFITLILKCSCSTFPDVTLLLLLKCAVFISVVF